MSEDEMSPAVEDSVDSSSSVSLGSNNNNNVLKMGPLFLSQSAELYYKQLFAANVAALTKPRLAASVRTTLGKTTLDQVTIKSHLLHEDYTRIAFIYRAFVRK